MKEKKKGHFSGLKDRPNASFKAKDETAFYMPAADITNMLPQVLSATFHTFAGMPSADKDVMTLFAKEVAIFFRDATLRDVTWEEYALPHLEKLTNQLEEKAFAGEFYKRCFMLFLDYFWHSKRLTTSDVEATSLKQMEKALDWTVLLRSLPKELRDQVQEHARVYNQLPNMLDNPPGYEICQKKE